MLVEEMMLLKQGLPYLSQMVLNPIKADLSNEDGINDLFTVSVEKILIAHVNILVNNAGFVPNKKYCTYS